MKVLLRIFSELGQKRTFEWADEGVEHLEKAVRPLELAKAEEEVKDLEQFPLKSKAEEKEEEDQPTAPTRKLKELHPHHQAEEEEEKEPEASTGVSFCQLDPDGECVCLDDDQEEEE